MQHRGGKVKKYERHLLQKIPSRKFQRPSDFIERAMLIVHVYLETYRTRTCQNDFRIAISATPCKNWGSDRDPSPNFCTG